MTTAPARPWSRLPFGFKGAIVVAASFLGNELLMGLTPRHPFPWAVPYFPIRTVGIALMGAVVIFVTIRRLIRQRSLRAAVDSAVAVPVVVAVVWFNYWYRGLIFFDLWQR